MSNNTDLLRAKRVLVVEKNPMIQMINHCFLSQLGCDVDLANSGHEAIKYLSLAHYELLILDLELPDMNGFEVCKHLRQQFSKSDLPIIGISAQDNKSLCIAAGMNDFIRKPAGKAVFKEVLDVWTGC